MGVTIFIPAFNIYFSTLVGYQYLLVVFPKERLNCCFLHSCKFSKTLTIWHEDNGCQLNEPFPTLSVLTIRNFSNFNFTIFRFRQMTSRASTKRSSVAASINGSISPPPDEEDRGLSTYRSSAANSSSHGPIFPQKKAKPNSPRDDMTNENRILRNGVTTVERVEVIGSHEVDGRGTDFDDAEEENEIVQVVNPELQMSAETKSSHQEGVHRESRTRKFISF